LQLQLKLQLQLQLHLHVLQHLHRVHALALLVALGPALLRLALVLEEAVAGLGQEL
jgi:hypothetical protein